MVPVEGELISVCVSVCDVLQILDNDFNYYHYQPGSHIVIVYFKNITHTAVIIAHYKRMG